MTWIETAKKNLINRFDDESFLALMNPNENRTMMLTYPGYLFIQSSSMQISLINIISSNFCDLQ